MKIVLSLQEYGKYNKKSSQKKRPKARQKRGRKPRSRTKTNGTLNSVVNVVEDNNDHIVVFKDDEEEEVEDTRDPLYCISNDLRLQKVKIPTPGQHHQPGDEHHGGGYQNITASNTYSQYDNYAHVNDNSFVPQTIGLPMPRTNANLQPSFNSQYNEVSN